MTLPPREFFRRALFYMLGGMLLGGVMHLIVVTMLGFSVWLALALGLTICAATMPSVVRWLRDALQPPEGSS